MAEGTFSDFPTFRPMDIIVKPSIPFSLTREELDVLALLEDRERIARARIRTIALPDYSGVRGFFMYGPGGHEKSYLVKTGLNELLGPGKWLLYNSDMSAPALLAEMEANQTKPFVFEDCEQLIGNRKNQGILRSAMAPPYRVNPKNMKVAYDFIFQAPIYILSNLSLCSSGLGLVHRLRVTL